MGIVQARDSEHANRLVQHGLAMPGDLVISHGTNKLFKVVRARKVKYVAMDEDGQEWLVRFAGLDAAPVGVVWAGPDLSESRTLTQRTDQAVKAREFSVGDVVQMIKPKDRLRFPGTYVITRKTSATRFKLQQVGGELSLTSPAGLIEKA